MRNIPRSTGEVAEIHRYRAEGWSWVRIAKKLGETPEAVRCAARRKVGSEPVHTTAAGPTPPGGRSTPPPPPPEAFEAEVLEEVQIDVPPSPEPPIEEIVREKQVRWDARLKHEQARQLVQFRMPELAPIGILAHGDPHTDDDGTNFPLLFKNADLVARTPGLYAASVGDMQNNWPGRLARLYAEQSTTQREAWRISAHWIERHRRKWLFIVKGNHDLWLGPNDPLDWICRALDVDLTQDWSIRIALQFPRGPEIRVRCAHDFPGSSMWNPAHAPSKALRMGTRDHLALCGHRHHWGYMPVQDPEGGGLLHACRIGSYKQYDQHARQLGHEGTVYPYMLFVIDPRLPESNPDRIKWFLDADTGADYLTWLRGRK
jgi:hypothetical protein